MPAIYPIATTRVSEALVQARLISQLEFDQRQLLRLQDQVSTGFRISSPSDDAPAAIRAIVLQRFIEQKQQAKTNLHAAESFIGATDTALIGASELLSHVQSLASQSTDSTLTTDQRRILRNEIENAIEQFMDIANRKFRGRFLFAGSKTSIQPFTHTGEHVVYHGNETTLKNFADVDFLSDTNVSGAEAFGAISAQVLGSVDLNPIVTLNTKLSDLRGGRGIDRGSFLISDGVTTKTINISAAETLGDVIELIEDNPPDGREINVTLSSHGLVVDMDDTGGGNLTIREVPGGATASHLGILSNNGVGTVPLVGQDVDPQLLATTRLQDILGTRASARVISSGGDNDIYIEAAQNGAAFNGVLVQFISAAAVGDQAIATYNAGTSTLTIDISNGVTRASTIVDAINTTGVFTAQLDNKLDSLNDGAGTVDMSATATTSGGSGEVLDQTSGIIIRNGGDNHTIDISIAQTVEDLLNILNGSEANVIAAINAQKRGIDIRSRLSGADFMIGENGGTTATQLGIRSLTEATFLSELNHGRGVEPYQGTDFVIQRRDGVTLDINVATAQTVGDVIDLINNHVANVGNTVTARLAQIGNGIELVDSNAAGIQRLTVIRTNGFAAWALGLVAHGQDQNVAAPAAVGQPELITGADVNPHEAEGLFNSLIRLSTAVEHFDISQIERAAGLIEANFIDLTFFRADLGSRARSLEVLNHRLTQEDIELRETLSQEIDADLVKAVSDLAARQANMEATLRVAAQSLKLSVLDFL